MKTIYKALLGVMVALGLASCSNEAPFTNESQTGTGRLLTSALDVKVKNQTPNSRALNNGVPDTNDFKVEFFLSSDSNMKNPIQEYTNYGSMPQIVELEAGKYIVKVTYGGTYGDNISNAAFNAPYYEGISDEFEVEVDKIVDDIQPILCELKNIRVKIVFDESLTSVMSSDSKVTVHVGESGTKLDYTKYTNEDGYFAYSSNSTTLAATFTGIIDGDNINETKTLNNIQQGNYYIITFRLHSADASDPGNIVPGDGDIVIDASATIIDLNSDDSYDDDVNHEGGDEYLEDDQRPENGDTGSGDQPGGEEPGEEDPNNPNPGGDENPDNEGPVVTGINGTLINQPNIIDANATEHKAMEFIVTSESEGGFTGFEVIIDSDLLDEQTLEEVTLAKYIDLIHPKTEEMKESLHNLGFPVEDEVEGKTNLSMSISAEFIGILSTLTIANEQNTTNTFIIKPTDSKGTSEYKLILEIRL